MPDLLVVLGNRAVGGEEAGHGGVGDGHFQPLVLVLIVPVHLQLGGGVGAKVLQHKVVVRMAAARAKEQVVVEHLEQGRVVREQGAVNHLHQGFPDLHILLKNLHGGVGALLVKRRHPVRPHAEDVDVLPSHSLGDFHIGPVQGANGDGAVHHQLHVAGAGSLLAGGGDLLGQVGGGDQGLSRGHVPVLNE